MKTDVNQLLFCTLEEAQKILSVNDPGYTIVLEGTKATVRNPSGVVVAEIDQKGFDAKELLHG
jgi:hypothetical protein